jgi:hypothetical protein
MKNFLLVFSAVILVILICVALAFAAPLRADVYDFVMLYTSNLGVIYRVPIYNTPAIEALTIAHTQANPADFHLFPYPYPPWYSLSTFYLGYLPPKVATNAWMFINIAMLAAAILLLSADWKPRQRLLALLAGLGFIPAIGLVVVGQYTAPVFLGAALFYYAAQRRDAPLTALGLLLMTFKPHIGMILFAAGFLWLVFHALPADSQIFHFFRRENLEISERVTSLRALQLTLLGGLLLAALGFLADPAWPLTYPKSLLSYSTVPGVASRDLSASFSVALIKMLLGHPSAFWSYWLSLALIILMLAIFWHRNIFSTPDTLIAAAAILTLLGDPYMFNYDYILLLIPLFILLPVNHSIAAQIILGCVYLLPWLVLLTGVGGNILLNLAGVVIFGLLVWRKRAVRIKQLSV